VERTIDPLKITRPGKRFSGPIGATHPIDQLQDTADTGKLLDPRRDWEQYSVSLGLHERKNGTA
jgi:hypothetical protein